jgi:hypothetical protein
MVVEVSVEPFLPEEQQELDVQVSLVILVSETGQEETVKFVVALQHQVAEAAVGAMLLAAEAAADPQELLAVQEMTKAAAAAVQVEVILPAHFRTQ